MKLIIKNKRYIILFFLLLVLAFLFPYTGDDWAWGSKIGIERLQSWFYNYSGRYAGNIIVLILTRSALIKTFCMALCLTGIVFLLHKLSGKKQVSFWLVILCLVFLPVPVLRQAVVWTSGFANYTVSIFLTLIYIFYCDGVYKKKIPEYSKWTAVFFGVLGIINTLIVEHLTIYNVLLSFWVLLMYFWRTKKLYIQHIAYCAGTIFGTIYMFMNPVYRSVAEGADGYRSIGSEQGIVSKVMDAYFNVIVEEGFLNNVVLNICFALVCILVWRKAIKPASLRNRNIAICCIGYITMYAAYSAVRMLSRISPLRGLKLFEGVLTAAFILAVGIFLLVLPVPVLRKIKLFFIYGSTGLIIAPLLVVSPIGSRCFFASYIMMIYLIVDLWNIHDSMNQASSQQENIRLVCKSMAGVSLAAFLYLIYIYGTIYYCDQIRVAAAVKGSEQGKEIIQVENLPYSNYVWCSSPTSGSVWEERFKLFYHLNPDAGIENVECHLH